MNDEREGTAPALKRRRESPVALVVVLLIIITAAAFAVFIVSGSRKPQPVGTDGSGATSSENAQAFISPGNDLDGEKQVFFGISAIEISVRDLPTEKVRLNFIEEQGSRQVVEYVCQPEIGDGK